MIAKIIDHMKESRDIIDARVFGSFVTDPESANDIDIVLVITDVNNRFTVEKHAQEVARILNLEKPLHLSFYTLNEWLNTKNKFSYLRAESGGRGR